MLAAQFAHVWENLCDYGWIQSLETKADASGYVIYAALQISVEQYKQQQRIRINKNLSLV